MTLESTSIGNLYPYQRAVFEAVRDSILERRGLVFSVEIARQGGKNELSAWLEAWLLMDGTQSPLNIVKCAPTFKPQAMISLRRLCDCLDVSDFAEDYIIEDGHIVRLGNARAIFLSAESSASVVGNTAHLLLEIDEAQDVSVDKFDRDFRPMAAAGNATTVLYGTPWREGNLLDTVKQRNLELEQADGVKRHFRYDWEEVACYNDGYRAFVEAERTRLGENHPTFRTQYALQNVSSGGGFFSDDQLMKLAGAHQRLRTPRPGAVYIGGLDFGGEDQLSSPPSGRGIKGEGSLPDSTVLTIGELIIPSPQRGEGRERGLLPDPSGFSSPLVGEELKERGHLPVSSSPHGERKLERGYLTRVVQQYSWTGIPFTLLLAKIADIARGWGLRRLVADATGLGAPLVAALKQSLGQRIVSFVFTTASKSALGYELLAAAGTGRLQLYERDASAECDACWHELESAAADYKENRSLNFYVDPSRGRDDYLMSLALTVEAAARYEPRAATGSSPRPSPDGKLLNS